MKRIASLRAAILGHYDAHKRDLPWRRTRDPYAIWVSEIMLQQTQVDVVKPRWVEFLKRFPDVRVLAAAPCATVCEAWAGLGYYRRARHLHKAARVLVDKHGAIFPRKARDLLELPGIGRYTAGAIASIAFGEEAPIVDGNVARVMARIFALDTPADSTAGQKRIWELATAIVAGERPGDLNQGLMELGATVCTPRNPRCLTCPVRPKCDAASRGEQELYPKTSRVTHVQAMHMAFAICRDGEGTRLTQRPLDGLWAGLWEPPSASGDDAARLLGERLGLSLGPPVAAVTHQLSHRAVTAEVYRLDRLPTAVRGLTAWADPMEAPLSALARKVLLEEAKSRANSSTSLPKKTQRRRTAAR